MIKPYYQDSHVTIYNCDCREILPELPKVDLVLTDPPYGIGERKRGTIGDRRRHKTAYTDKFKDTPEYIKSVCVPIIKKCIEISTAVIFTPGSKNLCYYPNPDSFGCFWQPATRGLQSWGRTDSQPIFYYGKDYLAGKTIQTCSFMFNSLPDKNGHPCPKPYKEWRKLVERGCPPAGIVADPFAGSCTTGRAAKDLNRKCICIEIEEKYAEIGAQRMKQEVLQF